MPRLVVSQAMPSPVNRPLIAVGSSEPGTETTTPASSIPVETSPVITNRTMNSMNGSGSLLPAHSTQFRARSVKPLLVGVVCAALMMAPGGWVQWRLPVGLSVRGRAGWGGAG